MLHLQNRVASKLPISLALSCELEIEAVFGKPSKNCFGSGICMVLNRLPAQHQLPCPHAPAWLSVKQGRLVFRFSKSEVVRKDATSRLNTPLFLVQEPFRVPRYIARHLGLPSLWVPAGAYAIEETSRDWFLAFDPPVLSGLGSHLTSIQTKPLLKVK